jgi:hypothetical protein
MLESLSSPHHNHAPAKTSENALRLMGVWSQSVMTMLAKAASVSRAQVRALALFVWCQLSLSMWQDWFQVQVKAEVEAMHSLVT